MPDAHVASHLVDPGGSMPPHRPIRDGSTHAERSCVRAKSWRCHEIGAANAAILLVASPQPHDSDRPAHPAERCRCFGDGATCRRAGRRQRWRLRRVQPRGAGCSRAQISLRRGPVAQAIRSLTTIVSLRWNYLEIGPQGARGAGPRAGALRMGNGGKQRARQQARRQREGRSGRRREGTDGRGRP